MPKFQGQTGQVLKIKLPSSIVSATWGDTQVAQGGRIALEVNTHWVSEGSDIEIALKDLEGAAIETIKGKVYSDIFRTQYLVSKPNKTGGMFFEAELKAHGLKALGPKVRVWPMLQWKDLKWLDTDGKEIKEISEGQMVDLEAKIQGGQEGLRTNVSLLCSKDGHIPQRFSSYESRVKDGKIRVSWQVAHPGEESHIEIHRDLEKHGTTYAAPTFTFAVECFGVRALSPEVKLTSWVEFEFGPAGGSKKSRVAEFEMPDGSVKKETVPEDGHVHVANALPGPVIFKGFAKE